MKTTRYFEEQVIRKRPYIQREWCELALQQPVHREVQPDVRIRYWIYITDLGKHLRVVTLEDGETILNAFPELQGGRRMKLHYYPETDSLYIELSEKASVDSQEVSSGVVLDFDDERALVGIDLEHASKVVNLARLDVEGLPMLSLSFASNRPEEKI